MGRKVFISFLGTNNYLQTHYIINGKMSAAVRFVQEALADEFCTKWDDESRIFIFYTEESKKCNWCDGGQPRKQEDSVIENRGLESVLKAKPYGNRVIGRQIPEGFSEDEVWAIFDTVYGELREGDEVYLDVTHAFRSIPLFSTILFQYARFMKGIILRQVCYGAFEKLGPAYKVKEIPIDMRQAPVLDLINVIQLQNMTEAANSFVQYGKIRNIATAFELGEDNRINNMIKEFQKQIANLEDYIQTNKIDKIEEGAFVQSIRTTMNNLRKNVLLSNAQLEILTRLESNISSFKINGGIDNIIAAFWWTLNYDMIIQAHVLALESIISATLNVIRGRLGCFDTELKKRNFVASILGISPEDKKAKKYGKELSFDIDLTEAIFDLPLIHQLRKPYGTIAKNRNELCHGKRSDLNAEKYKEQLAKKFQECMKLLNDPIQQ